MYYSRGRGDFQTARPSLAFMQRLVYDGRYLARICIARLSRLACMDTGGVSL